MSRHIFNTQHGGRRIQVCMGWDRPLQYVFMTVMDLSPADDKDEGEILYSNLNEPDPDALTLDHFRGVLVRLGLCVPAAMFEGVEYDRANNVGNRLVDHTAT